MDGVARQRRVLIERSVYGAAQIVVGRRSRKDFDLIDDDLNALDAFHRGFGVLLQVAAEHLAGKSDLIARSA